MTTYVNYFENIFNVNVLQPPNIQTELRPDGFEKPIYGDQCWENLQCTNIELDIVLKKVKNTVIKYLISLINSIIKFFNNS